MAAAGSVISPAGQPVGVAGGGASRARAAGRVDEALLVDAEAAVAAAAAVLAADGRGAPAVGGAAPARAPGGALEPMRCANRAGATLRAAAAMESPVVGALEFGEVVGVAATPSLRRGVAPRSPAAAGRRRSCSCPRAPPARRGPPRPTPGGARSACSPRARRPRRRRRRGATFDCTSAARDDATVAGLEGLCLGVAALPGSAAVRAARAGAGRRAAAPGAPLAAARPRRPTPGARARRARDVAPPAPRAGARAPPLAEDLDAGRAGQE
ncbi:hypothetical protein JL720_17327 [Aureococcus anophagefferens]|nr:hypothetical protein JL720_17327 [Aureococcus anophagefferens]